MLCRGRAFFMLQFCKTTTIPYSLLFQQEQVLQRQQPDYSITLCKSIQVYLEAKFHWAPTIAYYSFFVKEKPLLSPGNRVYQHSFD